MFHPVMTQEQVRQLARDRLVGLLAIQWPPMARQGDEAQQRELTELVTDVVDLLPAKASAETLTGILDRAWTALRRSYGGMTWPKSKLVREHVEAAVSAWKAKAPEAEAVSFKPKRPQLPHPSVCLAKAAQWPEGGALHDYWTRLANDAAIQWRAFAADREPEQRAMKGAA